ncbi:unnamed protein product [Sphagnum balticum]
MLGVDRVIADRDECNLQSLVRVHDRHQRVYLTRLTSFTICFNFSICSGFSQFSVWPVRHCLRWDSSSIGLDSTSSLTFLASASYSNSSPHLGQ